MINTVLFFFHFGRGIERYADIFVRRNGVIVFIRSRLEQPFHGILFRQLVNLGRFGILPVPNGCHQFNLRYLAVRTDKRLYCNIPLKLNDAFGRIKSFFRNRRIPLFLSFTAAFFAAVPAVARLRFSRLPFACLLGNGIIRVACRYRACNRFGNGRYRSCLLYTSTSPRDTR